MSIRCISWVLDHSDAQHAERLVLLALADRADDDGRAWPSVRDLATRARLSRRAVQVALRRLKLAQSIEPAGLSRAGTTVYRIITTGGAKSAPRAKSAPAQNATEGGAESRKKGAQSLRPNRQLQPSVNRQGGSPPTKSAGKRLTFAGDLSRFDRLDGGGT
jgi:hypothetical protein